MKALSDDPLWSFDSLRSINTRDRFTHFDYVRVLRQSGKIDIGNLLEWLASYTPSLVDHQGRVYFAEHFSEEDLKNVQSRVSSAADAQLFVNLVNITDLLGPDSAALAHAISREVAGRLNVQIAAQFPSLRDRAESLVDEGESYITIVGP